jgi:hypothetical protein
VHVDDIISKSTLKTLHLKTLSAKLRGLAGPMKTPFFIHEVFTDSGDKLLF